jgi:hypothetical protein
MQVEVGFDAVSGASHDPYRGSVHHATEEAINKFLGHQQTKQALSSEGATPSPLCRRLFVRRNWPRRLPQEQ